MKYLARLIPIFLLINFSCSAQSESKVLPVSQDSLRGSITKERAWWDVIKYDITITPDYNNKSISGTNIMTVKTIAAGKRMQVDLQEPMLISSIIYDGKSVKFQRNGNVYYADFGSEIKKGTVMSLSILFKGKPKEAVNPPWDGGWIWKKDSYGNPWMSVACQGLGASVWYPCKDHQSDEPDSASLTMIVPDTLTAVANGRLRKFTTSNGKSAYTWAVVNPINSYNLVPYIGKYVNWSEKFQGEKGSLDVNYWVLEESEEKARKQFTQVPKMLKCFEHWFGPYPFYEDGYKLVESPHLGMEHQSAIAYGNKFINGYKGKDLSGTGWGDKWDFIIVHESAHEWFANNITTNDIADMWVHEGFTNFSEVLFTTCEYGAAAGNEYCLGIRGNIENKSPVIGPYGVNKEGSVDMYPKGANIVQMVRQIIDDDEKFRQMLRKMNSDFYHSTVTSKIVEEYISKYVGKNLSKMFDQYLRTVQIPELQYKVENGTLSYRWTNCISGFDMPVRIYADKEIWLDPTEEWKSIKVGDSAIRVDPNFYIVSTKM